MPDEDPSLSTFNLQEDNVFKGCSLELPSIVDSQQQNQGHYNQENGAMGRRGGGTTEAIDA